MRIVRAVALPLALLGPALPAPAQAQDTYAASPVALARELLLRAVPRNEAELRKMRRTHSQSDIF